MNARPTLQTSADALIKCVPAGVGIRSCTGTCIRQTKKKQKKKGKKKDGEIDSASLNVPLPFCSLIATSKTLQSLLHSLKTTIDEVLDNAVVCLVCQIARRNGALKLEVIERAVPCRLQQILPQKVIVLDQWFNRELKNSFWLLSRQFFHVSDEGPGFDRSRSWMTHRCVRRVLLLPSASYANPISFVKKTANQVVSGLKLKLKTSPTKVRLVSLKKSWKQAGRSLERRDVDFAESADFAEYDLRNRTQLNGHSNMYKRGFPLACSMPNFNDVRLKEMPKKGAKNRKNRHHIAPRGHGVKGAKFQCQSRDRSAAEISQRATHPGSICELPSNPPWIYLWIT